MVGLAVQTRLRRRPGDAMTRAILAGHLSDALDASESARGDIDRLDAALLHHGEENAARIVERKRDALKWTDEEIALVKEAIGRVG